MTWPLRTCLVSVICALLAFFPGCSGSLKSSHERIIRLLTYNIHHGEGTDGRIDINRIAKIILQSDADIVALQDVDRWVGRTNKIDMMTGLADLTGMTYAYGKCADLDGGENGNGLLTRFPILEEKNLHYQARASNENGSLMQLVLDIKGMEFVLMNTDLSFAENDSERVLIVRAIGDVAIDHHNVPVILCGSMNDEPRSRTIAALGTDFRDSWSDSGAGNGFTYPSIEPQKRIDYIFVSNSVAPADTKSIQTTLASAVARVLASNASDHLPVLVELKIVSE